MRILTFDSALTALVLVASSLAQTRPTPSQIFKSPDGTFQFRFPKSLVLCQPQLNGWTPESCSSYLAICPRSITATPSGPLHPETVACVAYPNSAYKGTNFGGAAFSVGEVADAKTQTDCLQFDELTTDPKKAHWQTVGGVKFRANSGGEGGLGHGLSADIYLTFHNGKCYDVEIRTTQTSIANFDPGTIKEFKDYEKVSREMRRILNSLRFLK